MEEKKYTLLQKIGFFLGPVLGFILAFAVTIPGLPSIGCKAFRINIMDGYLVGDRSGTKSG